MKPYNAYQNIIFIYSDERLKDKITFYNNRNDQISFFFRTKPFKVKDVALQILPADLFCHYYDKYSEIFSQAHNIIYGDPFFIKNSFDLGAVDFLRMPFSMEELMIRIKKALKDFRLQYIWGDLIFSGTRIYFGEKSIELSGREREIFFQMYKYRGSILKRDWFNRAIKGRKNLDSRVLDYHISCLRKKLQTILPDEILSKDVIQTINHKGYILA